MYLYWLFALSVKEQMKGKLVCGSLGTIDFITVILFMEFVLICCYYIGVCWCDTLPSYLYHVFLHEFHHTYLKYRVLEICLEISLLITV
jgi:hypothetical protein